MPERSSAVNVLILSTHGGRLDRRTVAQANTLAASGRDVSLLSVPVDLQACQLDGGVATIMDPYRDGQVRWPRLRSFAAILPAWLAGPMKRLRYAAGVSPVTTFSDYCRRVCPQTHIDAISCQDLDTLPAGVDLRRSRWPDAKIIYDAHELYPFQFSSWILRRYWRRVEARHIAEADLVTTANDSCAKDMADRYGIARPEVVYSGCDRADPKAESADLCSHFGAPESPCKVLFQGNLVPGRNLRNLLLAFKLVRADATLLLLGDGPMAGKLRALCGRAGLTNICFGRPVPQEALVPLVRQADLGIVPYLGDRLLNNRYCTPNKLFEFIEAGIPICASDLPELRNLVDGCGIGYTSPMKTPEQIASAVDTCIGMLRQGAFRPDAAQAARERFGWPEQGRKLLALYEALGV